MSPREAPNMGTISGARYAKANGGGGQGLRMGNQSSFPICTVTNVIPNTDLTEFKQTQYVFKIL